MNAVEEKASRPKTPSAFSNKMSDEREVTCALRELRSLREKKFA
jgi:hypothetical protein